jgi:hypothetical protein
MRAAWVSGARRSWCAPRHGGLKFLEAAHIKDPVSNLGNPLQPNEIGNQPLFVCPYSALKISPGVLDPHFKRKPQGGAFMAQGRADLNGEKSCRFGRAAFLPRKRNMAGRGTC